MEMRIEPYEAHHLDAIIRLSLRAWAPVFDSLADVCQKEDITPDAVLGIIDHWIASAIDWNTVPAFSLMGVDEIAIKKGHCDYVAIVTARLPSADLLRLAVLPDRTKETLSSWLQTIPAPLRSQIGTVCTDMWQGYVAAVQAVLPGAALVVDRFHVGQQYRDDADRLRKQELKRLRQELAKGEVKRLKKTLWPFRKRAANLEPDEQERLDCLFAHSLHLKQAYDFREQLTAIFDTARSKAEGMRRIKAWRRKDLSVWCRFTYHHIRRRAKVGAIQGWPECYQPANRPSRQCINHALYKILMILKCCAESHNDKRVGMIARPRRLPRLGPGRIVKDWADHTHICRKSRGELEGAAREQQHTVKLFDVDQRVIKGGKPSSRRACWSAGILAAKNRLTIKRVSQSRTRPLKPLIGSMPSGGIPGAGRV